MEPVYALPMTFQINDPKWAEELQRGLDEYRAQLYDSVDSEEEVETESGIPFCGCDTCDNREILSYIAPRVIKAYQEEKIELV